MSLGCIGDLPYHLQDENAYLGNGKRMRIDLGKSIHPEINLYTREWLLHLRNVNNFEKNQINKDWKLSCRKP